MAEVQKPLPMWILIVSGFFAFMEVGVSIAMCLSPESVLENVDLNANGVHNIVYMWAARQFALGVIFGFATFKKSVPMLTIAYVFFFVMFIGDLLIGISQQEKGLTISAIIMCAIASAMIVVINREK